MTRRTYVYDKDSDEMIQVYGPGTNQPPPERSGLQIVRDIEGYQAVASDVASGGAAPWIGSRSRHRVFLRDNRYVETGNEAPVSGHRPETHWGDQIRARAERVETIRRAMGDYGSNTGARR